MAFSAKTDAESFDITEQPNLVSAAKPRRGRPPTLTDERQRRKRRSVSLSDHAWQNLEEMAERLGYSSKSDLLEHIGKEELKLTKSSSDSHASSSLADVLIYRRLQGLFDPHSDVLHSLFAFNTAIRKKIETLQPDSGHKLMIEDLLASMSVVFQHCYIRPDRYVNSLSALSRLINYCLLLNKAGLANDWSLGEDVLLEKHTFDDPQASDCLAKIGSAMSHLSKASFSLQFTALRLKYVSGFTEAQIKQVYELQGMPCTIEDIRRLVHEGWAKFRKHRYKPSDIGSSKESIGIPPEAVKYCQLLWTSSLNTAKDRNALLRILVKATYCAPVNFWLCEIEHEWGINFLQWSARQTQELSALQGLIQKRLNQKLQDSKETLDKEMHYCLSREEAVKNLAAIFEQETGISETTELGGFMISLLQGEAEELFALLELKKLRHSMRV